MAKSSSFCCGEGGTRPWRGPQQGGIRRTSDVSTLRGERPATSRVPGRLGRRRLPASPVVRVTGHPMSEAGMSAARIIGKLPSCAAYRSHSWTLQSKGGPMR